MKPKDLYRILGVARDAQAQGIRSAYLRLAKDLHPDHAGECSSRAFRDVQRAYDVLSDPVQRREYDCELDRKRPARSWHAEPVSRHSYVEPLVPQPPQVARRARHTARPVDPLVHQALADLTPIGAPQTVRAEVVDLAVTISEKQALRGGVLPVGIPMREECPFCGGTGLDWPFRCVPCRGRGSILRERSVPLHIAPGTPSGAVADLRLESPGGTDVVLRLRLQVDRRMRAPPDR